MLLDVNSDLEQCISRIRKMGVRLAIDDFGTGYSNLSYLQKFDVSMLKIDRSFIAKMNQSKQDLAIVEAIINMSKSLNLQVVAEGVENQETLNELLSLNCTIGQGYFWTKPIDITSFIKYLSTVKHVLQDDKH